jgi:hypothetical protein
MIIPSWYILFPVFLLMLEYKYHRVRHELIIQSQLGRLSKRWELEMQQNQLSRQGSWDICMTCLRSLQGCQSTRALQVTRGWSGAHEDQDMPETLPGTYYVCRRARKRAHSLRIPSSQITIGETCETLRIYNASHDWPGHTARSQLIGRPRLFAAFWWKLNNKGRQKGERHLMRWNYWLKVRIIDFLVWLHVVDTLAARRGYTTSHSTHYPPPLFLRTWNFWLMKEDMLRQMDRRVKGS